MARKSTPDIHALKASLDILRIIQERGIELKKTGKEYMGCCPFHEDNTPSFSVNPQKGLWQCFGCGKGGDVITFVQEIDHLDFHQAVERLKGGAVHPRSGSVSRLRLLSQVFEFYARTFEQDARGYEYLKSRGIKSPALFKRFRFGFSNGSMMKTLSSQLKKELTDIGILTKSGAEFFHDCVVFPLVDAQGQIVNLYGRALAGSAQAKHRFLPGPQRGLFYPPKGSQSLILTEGIIDALTLYEAGYTNVLALYGINGLTEDHLAFIKQERIMQLTLCLDGDDAGRKGIEPLKEKLQPTGASILSVRMPEGLDVNEFFQTHDGTAFSALLEASEKKNASKNGPKETVIEGGFIFDFGDRRYRVLEMNLSGLSRLRVNLKASCGEWFHIDTLDLYLERMRERFAEVAARRFSCEASDIQSELLKLVDILEAKRNHLLAASTNDHPKGMTDEERAQALSFLRSPDLIECINRDFDRTGYIGEDTARVFCYLAQISRFLESPLGILIVSRSGAGKSSLQEAVLKFIPEEVLENYARLSGKALFYKKSLKHKVLAIAEDEGAQEAIYSIRILASEQRLAVSVAAVDPKTGEKRTEDFYVEGPTSVFWTSTSAEKLDFETRNRFCIVTIDESREQTRRILARQRERESLEGMLEAEEELPIFKKHHNAQRLLRKIKVINPYARELTYADDNLLMRREQKKYLTLIKAIAFLHQYQREIKKGVTKSGREIEYIEVTLGDIALANRLAAEVLGRSLDELSPHTRALLKLIKQMIDERIQAGKKQDDLLFSRKELCRHTGWGYFQIRRPLEALADMEYVIARKNGKSHQLLYELLWKGEGESGEKFLLGLIDVEELKKKFKR